MKQGAKRWANLSQKTRRKRRPPLRQAIAKKHMSPWQWASWLFLESDKFERSLRDVAIWAKATTKTMERLKTKAEEISI